MLRTHFVFSLVVGLGLHSNCHASSPSCEVATHDGVRAVYKNLTGTDLPTEHECIKVSHTFVGLVRIGTFYLNRGCQWDKTLYDCQLDPKDIPRRAMAAAGWAKGDAKRREQLALAWLGEVDDTTPIAAQPKRWEEGHKTFMPLQAKATPDGGLELKFWQQDRPGKRPVFSYRLLSVTFAADGTEGKTEELDECSFPSH